MLSSESGNAGALNQRCSLSLLITCGHCLLISLWSYLLDDMFRNVAVDVKNFRYPENCQVKEAYSWCKIIKMLSAARIVRRIAQNY